jgi:hypothetical protein
VIQYFSVAITASVTRQGVPGGKVNIWEVIVSVILSKILYMHMCPIPNGFRDRAISLYNSKIVDKKKIIKYCF